MIKEESKLLFKKSYQIKGEWEVISIYKRGKTKLVELKQNMNGLLRKKELLLILAL